MCVDSGRLGACRLHPSVTRLPPHCDHPALRTTIAAAASAGAKGVAWWLRSFQGAGGRREGAGAAGLDVDPIAEGPQRRWWGVVRRGGAVRSGGGRASGKGGKGAGKKKDKTPSAAAAADAGMLVGKKKGGSGGGRGELDPSESEDEVS